MKTIADVLSLSLVDSTSNHETETDLFERVTLLDREILNAYALSLAAVEYAFDVPEGSERFSRQMQVAAQIRNLEQDERFEGVPSPILDRLRILSATDVDSDVYLNPSWLALRNEFGVMAAELEVAA